MKAWVFRESVDWPGDRPWVAINRHGWLTHHETWEQAMVAAHLVVSL